MDNSQLVGVQGGSIVILLPKQKMSKQEAVEFAAWLVILADDNNEFEAVKTKIENGE